MVGKTHSLETKALISVAKIGKNNPMSKNIFVYSFDLETQETKHYKNFETCTDAAKFFNCSNALISKYLDSNKLFKKDFLLSSSLIIKE